MNNATLDKLRYSPRRTSRWLATDVTTSGVVEEVYPFVAPRSVDLSEQDTAIGQLTVCIRESRDAAWQKCLWSTTRHFRNLLVHYVALEAAEEQVGLPGDATASEIPWRGLWDKTIHALAPPRPANGPLTLNVPSIPRPEARTALGRRLREIRQQIVASGERLLSLEELDRELASRRGEPPTEND